MRQYPVDTPQHEQRDHDGANQKATTWPSHTSQGPLFAMRVKAWHSPHAMLSLFLPSAHVPAIPSPPVCAVTSPHEVRCPGRTTSLPMPLHSKHWAEKHIVAHWTLLTSPVTLLDCPSPPPSWSTVVDSLRWGRESHCKKSVPTCRVTSENLLARTAHMRSTVCQHQQFQVSKFHIQRFYR